MSGGSIRIQVEYPGSNHEPDLFTIALPETQKNPNQVQQYHVATYTLCELKRQIAKSTKIDPLSQQLSFGSGTQLQSINDDVLLNTSLFPKIYCVKRNRNPINTLTIKSCAVEEYQLKVDRNDTVIDMKFILAQMLDTRPEYLQFVENFQRRIFTNTNSLVASGLLRAKQDPKYNLRYWVEFPSSTPLESSFIVRSLPRLEAELLPELQSIGKCFRSSCNKFPNNNHLGTRLWHSENQRGEYRWQTFSQISKRVTNIASGMIELGLKKGSKIGICSANRAEWVLADYANHCQGMITIPLYDTLSKNAIEYIVNHAGVEAIHCTKETLVEVLKAQKVCPTLKYIILMDDEVPDQVFVKSKNGTKQQGYTHTLSQIEKLGESNPKADNFSGSDELCTICYTSGTTGNPKGVMITNRNLLISIQAFLPKLTLDLDESGAILSYLPLAHMYEKLMELVALIVGCRIGYWSGDVTTILSDIETLKPSYFAGVPRVYQRFQDKILVQVNSSNFIRKKLFNTAYKSKEDSLIKREEPSHLWEKLVFSKIKDKFGGNVKAAVSGSAPLSSTTANFIKICFSDVLVQGYGLTETSAAGAVSDRDDFTYGHNGSILPSVEMKLMDVSDMNYFSNDKPNPRGEIWLRGKSIFTGYYKMIEKTNEVLTKDGWFATGDIGEWCNNGTLKIIDRKKNIFKLAQGEYIRPDYIENVYKQCLYVGNIFVHGDSNETYLVGIVVPDFEVLTPWAKSNGIGNYTFETLTDEQKEQLVKHPKTHEMLLREMNKIATREELTGFEKVKRITIVSEDFTIENGILTSTMKLKRNVARNKYKNEITNMYKSVAQSKL